VLFFGLLYFIIGYFTYKYQLLYAMDHPQHSTGRAWPMICYRIMIGLVVFQLAMAGVLALKSAFKRSALVVPLIFATIWFSYFYERTFGPLTKFIALKSIQRSDDSGAGESLSRRPSITLDEQREEGQKFVNPNLVIPYVYPSSIMMLI
jgi:hypothetical protein